MEKFDIPDFQHRLFQRLSVLSFKLLNFKAAPKILKDDILNNFLDLSNLQLNPLLVPESIKELRSRTINIFSKEKSSFHFNLGNSLNFIFIFKSTNIQ